MSRKAVLLLQRMNQWNSQSQ